MLSVEMDKIGDMAIVECGGTIACSEEAQKLGDAVTSHRDAKIIVLDLSEVVGLGGSGARMLVFLQTWTHHRRVKLKLFNPSRSVRAWLHTASALPEFDITPLGEMMALLSQADSRYALEANNTGLHQAA
jgi:anti-anti-sigma regulatory factor